MLRACIRAGPMVVILLGLISSGWSAPTAQSTSQEGSIVIKKKLTKSWTDAKCAVICAGKQTPSMVKAKKAVYAVYDVAVRKGPVTTVPVTTVTVTAFVTPETGKLWIGPEQDYYIETDSGIVGFQMRLGAYIFWCKSMAKKPIRTVTRQREKDDPSRTFGRTVSGAGLLDAQWSRNDREARLKRKTGLKMLNPWFRAAALFSSESGLPKISNATIDDGLLKLDLKNQTGEYEASVWIDIKSKKVIKAVEDKEQYKINRN